MIELSKIIWYPEFLRYPPTQKETVLSFLLIFMYNQEKFLRFAQTMSS